MCCRRWVLIVAVLSLTNTAVHATDGDFDTSWGIGGKLQFDVTSPGNNEGKTLLIQPDGKLLMAGTCSYSAETSFCASRQLPNGSFDTTFGPSNHPGRVIIRENPMADIAVTLAASALSPDGGSVYAGDVVASSPSRTGFVVKLNAVGDYVARGFVGSIDRNGAYAVSGIAVQPDGKVVVAGGVFTPSDGTSYFSVQRLLADLSDLDHSFGDDGTKLIVFPGEVDPHPKALALQPDGKIVVVGIVDLKVGIVRLLANGQLDDDPLLGFGDGGRVTYDWGVPAGANASGANAVAIERDGSLLIAGYALRASTGNYDFFVNRLTPRGRQDPVFNLSLWGLPKPAYIDFNFGDSNSNFDNALALAVQPDGKILVSGLALQIGTVQYFAVARLTQYGSTDFSFGSSGQIRAQYNPGMVRNDSASAIAVGNGGIMVAGSSQGASGPNYRFGIAKLKLDLIFSDGLE